MSCLHTIYAPGVLCKICEAEQTSPRLGPNALAYERVMAEAKRAAAANTESLLDERHKTHGSFAQNAVIGQRLRELFRASETWDKATPRQREALDMIACKLSRILSGQPGHADHWDDIAGYAKLAANPDLQR